MLLLCVICDKSFNLQITRKLFMEKEKCLIKCHMIDKKFSILKILFITGKVYSNSIVFFVRDNISTCKDMYID